MILLSECVKQESLFLSSLLFRSFIVVVQGHCVQYALLHIWYEEKPKIYFGSMVLVHVVSVYESERNNKMFIQMAFEDVTWEKNGYNTSIWSCNFRTFLVIRQNDIIIFNRTTNVMVF